MQKIKRVQNLFFILLLNFTGVYSQKTVVIDTSIHFQTIEGWGHGGGILGFTGASYFMLDSAIANPVNYEVLDYVADDLGLTGSRTWEVGPRVDGTGMDNGDCDSIDWNKFQGGSLPLAQAIYLVHFKNRVLSKGYQPSFYSSPGYPSHATGQKPWVLNHPGERAQQIWASALYMKNTYGININYDVIYNEPPANFTDILTDDIKALAPRLQSHGLSTKSQYAEAIAPQNDWNFISPVQNDSDLWPLVGRLSYHNYGTADPYRSYILNFGLTKGIITAQTEMENPTFDELYSDLTVADVSYWEVAFSANRTLVPDSGLTSFIPSATYFRLRQVLHYVTPGSIRIVAIANDTLLHVLSFIKNGIVTTVIENLSSTQNVLLSGLPPGTYGLSHAVPGANAFQESGLYNVGSADTLTIPVTGNSAVTTLYPYSGANHPPTIMTFRPVPGYLVLPVSTAILSATANDAELDPLSYHWTILQNPAGANPVFNNANASSTSVNGLNVAGTYVFNIDVNDGINTSSKQVYLVVYNTNPSPVLGACGFRIAAPYGLVFANQGDTTHANIEPPTSAVTLQAGISDLANSDFTGRGTWSLIQQPSGAAITLSSTTYIFISLRATVTGMTIPGDYIFQINVTDPGHPDITAQIICTVHPTSSAPFIVSITPASSQLTLPASGTLITAVTSDPENDLLRHWWVIKSAPSGSHPVFDHQGLAITNVNGLTVPGLYTFTLRVFDDLHMTTRDVSIQVNTATGIKNNIESNNHFIFPNPFSNRITVQTNNNQVSEIIIYDVASKILLQQKFNGSIILNAELFSQGLYLYELINKDGLIERGKIVKE